MAQVYPYTLHKWCSEIPRELPPHTSHPDHPLILYKPTNDPDRCDSCYEKRNGFIYKCTSTDDYDNACLFNLHVQCALFPDPVTTDMSGDQLKLHSFSLMGIPGTLCGICGYECHKTCFLLSYETVYHFQCLKLPRRVKHEVHRHELSLRPPLIEEDWYTEFYCDACEKERNPDAYVYYCEPCKLVAHIGCGISGSSRPVKDVIGNSSVYKLVEKPKSELDLPTYEFYNVEEAEEYKVAALQEKVEHVYHQHPLSLVNFTRTMNPQCTICSLHIFGLTYYCKHAKECNFYIHKRCAELPKQIDSWMHHDHGPLKQMPEDRYICCNFCGELYEGFPFGCTICKYRLDPHCAILPKNLNHPSHEHELSSVFIYPWRYFEEKRTKGEGSVPIKILRNPSCQACGYLCEGLSLMCEDCDFYLHVFCSLLPLSGKHETHKHELDLTYNYKEDPNALEFICDTCEKPRIPDKWVYCCPDPKCYIVSHVDCVAPDVFTPFKDLK